MFECCDCEKGYMSKCVSTWDKYLTMCRDCADERIAVRDAQSGDFDWGDFTPPDENRLELARERLGIDGDDDDDDSPPMPMPKSLSIL